jgi:CBS domain-containing protein
VQASLAEITPISEIMTRGAFCASSEQSVDSVSATFLERGISGAAVIDERGRAIGVVSKTDLIRGRYAKSIGDVMTPVAFTMKENAPISQAAALMAFEGIHRLPVVSSSGEVVGIVSSIDVLRWIAERDGYMVRARV